MGLREKLQKTADKLISKHGDSVQSITVTSIAGATEFDVPTLLPTETVMDAVVTGVGRWDVSDTILSTDLKVLVSGSYTPLDIGGIIMINDAPHKIIMKREMLATGTVSAVSYFVRRG